MFRVSLKKTLQLSLHFPVRASENKATGSRDVSKLIVPIARNYLTNRSSFPLRRNEETILGWIHEIPRIQITAEWTRLVHNVRKTTRRGGGNVREATNEKVSWKKSVRQFSLLSFFFPPFLLKVYVRARKFHEIFILKNARWCIKHYEIWKQFFQI